ncbi:hydrolase [Lithospermum erythrorhizon]|uniref:Hydrolase n=1 Tax=Lithospermum erythrorhizon TaxID=34254 RepID=A0AAV3QWU0_LITER
MSSSSSSKKFETRKRDPDPRSSVLLVIDMQNDFYSIAKTMLPEIKTTIELCRKASIPIIYTRHCHKSPSDHGMLHEWWDGDLIFDGTTQAEIMLDVARARTATHELESVLVHLQKQDLTEDPFPSLDTAYQKIREEECMRKAIDTSLGTKLVTLSLRSGTRLPDCRDKSKLSCTHCKKQGHDITICFFKVGYLKWWETRNQRGPRGGSAIRSRAAVQSASERAALNAVFSDATGSGRVQTNAIDGTGPMASLDEHHC